MREAERSQFGGKESQAGSGEDGMEDGWAGSFKVKFRQVKNDG